MRGIHPKKLNDQSSIEALMNFSIKSLMITCLTLAVHGFQADNSMAEPVQHEVEIDFKCTGPGGTNCALHTLNVPGSLSKYHQEYVVTYDFTSCGSTERLSTLYVTAKERVTFELWYKRRDTQRIKGYELSVLDSDPNWTLGEILGSACKLKMIWSSQLSDEAKQEFDTSTGDVIETLKTARKALVDNASYQSWSNRITSDPETWVGRLKSYIAQMRASGNTETADNLESVLLGESTLLELQKNEMMLVCLASEVLEKGHKIQSDRIASTYGKHEDLQTKYDQLKATIGVRVCVPSSE
jgi:hypothetical protein